MLVEHREEGVKSSPKGKHRESDNREHQINGWYLIISPHCFLLMTTYPQFLSLNPEPEPYQSEEFPTWNESLLNIPLMPSQQSCRLRLWIVLS